MKLHANAALSLKGRRELSRRVVSGERTLSEAAAAAEVSVRCARKWVGRYRAEAELGLLDRSSAPRSIPHQTSERRVKVIAVLRRLRVHRPRDRRGARHGALDRVGHPDQAWDGQAWPSRPGARPAIRARHARRT